MFGDILKRLRPQKGEVERIQWNAAVLRQCRCPTYRSRSSCPSSRRGRRSDTRPAPCSCRCRRSGTGGDSHSNSDLHREKAQSAGNTDHTISVPTQTHRCLSGLNILHPHHPHIPVASLWSVTIHRTRKNEQETTAGVRRVRTIPRLLSWTFYTWCLGTVCHTRIKAQKHSGSCTLAEKKRG